MQCRDLLQDLIRNIHKAPSLENIIFKEKAIKLMDMEDLHTSLPKLKSVVLDGVSLYRGDNTNTIGHTFSKALESFSLLNFDMVNPNENATNTIRNWISYIDASYRHLEELNLESGEYYQYNYCRYR